MPEILDPNVCLTPEVILFDWDGVLVDTKDLIQEAYLATFAALDQEPIEIDTVHQLPGTSLRDYFPQIFGKEAEEAEKVFYQYVHENHISSLKSMPHAKDLLETIYAHKIPMAVVSNKRGDILRKEAKHLSYDCFFYEIIGATDCAEDKPSKVPVVHALKPQKKRLPNPKIWFVGDWKADMECADNAGIVPVLMGNTVLKNPGKGGIMPKIYVESCLDLKNLLIQYIERG